MKNLRLMVTMGLFPAALMAQQGTSQDSSSSRRGSAQSQGSVTATAGRATMSADVQAKLEVVLQRASEHALPVKAIENRVAEGVAKGASEAQIILAASALEARLEASQSAIIRGGRERPAGDEVESGANAMERGASAAHIRALVEHTPSDRSLVVAFDVLTALIADGRPVGNAVAQIQAKLDARAPDAAIGAITGSGNASGNNASNAQPGAAASGTSSASANAALKGAVQGSASATATIGGVIRR
jgi:hypothetical protein